MKKTRARKATTSKNILRVPPVLLVPFPMDVRIFLDGNLSICVFAHVILFFTPYRQRGAPATAGEHDAPRSSHDALP